MLFIALPFHIPTRRQRRADAHTNAAMLLPNDADARAEQIHVDALHWWCLSEQTS